MSKLDEGIIDKEELIKWCLERQTSGFQGRPNKKADICYGFWIGASLCLLDSFDLVNQDELRKFQSSCQPKMGGFGKDPESYSGKRRLDKQTKNITLKFLNRSATFLHGCCCFIYNERAGHATHKPFFEHTLICV